MTNGVSTNGLQGERYEPRVNRAIALVDAHVHEQLSLETLADAACLSPFHFHRVFTALVGETVHDFTSRLRLERALKMKRAKPGESWKRIASACGYRSPSVFSRAFKRQYGFAPAAFDVDAYWAQRPDADVVHTISDYFLRPAPPVPGDFIVDIVFRPAAHRVMARAWGVYTNPAALIAGYERLIGWATLMALPTNGGLLAGGSSDDPEITPLSRCRYDLTLDVDRPVSPPAGLTLATRDAGWWATHRITGDFAAVDRGWNTLFKSWLPASGLDLRDVPAEEVYLRTPAEIGWEKFDLLCCVPVHPPRNGDVA